MRILVIIPDMIRYGGTCSFLEKLLSINRRHGITTSLLAPAEQTNNWLSSLADRHAIELVVSSRRLSPECNPLLTPLIDALISWPIIFKRCPDLIVVSTADPGRMSIPLFFPTPVLYVLHTIPEHRFRLLPRWYLWAGSKLNNLVMTVSEAAANDISSLMGIPRSRIEVVHNSCPVGVCGTERGNTPVILTVGHLVDYKNPWFWLEIVRRVLSAYPDAMCVWLGDGELLQSLRHRVRELSLEERILLPGYVEDPSLWYQQASVYLQPSRRESHGIAVLEAMAHGLPCVVADSGGLPESVLDGETGYVCPLADPACFAGHIKTLLRDPVLRSTMGAAGRQRVETCFSEAAQEEKLLYLYGQLVQQAGK